MKTIRFDISVDKGLGRERVVVRGVRTEGDRKGALASARKVAEIVSRILREAGYEVRGDGIW